MFHSDHQQNDWIPNCYEDKSELPIDFDESKQSSDPVKISENSTTNLKLVEPEMLFSVPEHQDDWISNDDNGDLHLPLSQPSSDQINISKESTAEMKSTPLHVNDVPCKDVKQNKRVLPYKQKDPDYVYGRTTNTSIKRRKSNRGWSSLRFTSESDTDNESPDDEQEDFELTYSENAESSDNSEGEEQEAQEKNQSLQPQDLNVGSTSMHTRWKRKHNVSMIKKLRRAKARLQKPSRLERIDDEFVEYQEHRSRSRLEERVATWFINETGHEYLDMNLIPYPSSTADIAKIPTKGKQLHKNEEGLYSQKNEFPCPPCGKYFSNKFFAIAHIHRVHFQIRSPWRCNQCTQVFTESRRLRVHLKNHELGKLFVCPICKKHSTVKNAMDGHVLDHEKGKATPTCHVCNQSFSHFKGFVNHMKEHGYHYPDNYIPKKQICELCSAKFTHTKQLIYHKIKKHNEVDQEGRYPICAECSEVLYDDKKLEKHAVRVHGRGSQDYFCEYCGKGFVLESDLRHHVKQCSDNEDKACQICGDTSRGEVLLKRHILRRHPETVKMSEEEVDEYVKKKKAETPFQCKLCPQAFSFQNLLYHHHRKDHPEVTDKFKCSECGKGFSRQCSVKRHYESYHLKLEYKCDLCGKRTTSKDGLTQHQRLYCKAAKPQKNTEQKLFQDTLESTETISQTLETEAQVKVPEVANDIVVPEHESDCTGFEQFVVIAINNIDVTRQ